MRKTLSVFLLAFAGLALLIAVACGIFLANFDPNDYKRQIASVVENATGRQLFFQDDMTLSFFPGLRLETGRLELNDPGEFGPEPFLRLGGATFSLALEPLFDRRIVVEEITLHDPRLKLCATMAGRGNWEYGFSGKGASGEAGPASPSGGEPSASDRDGPGSPEVTPLADSPSANGSAASPASAGERKGALAGLSALQVRRIACTGASVVYNDLRRGRSFTGRIDSFHLNDVRLDADMPFTLSGNVEDDAGSVKGGFGLQGKARVAGSGDLSLDVAEFTLAAEGAFPLTLQSGAEFRYDASTRALRLENFTGRLVLPFGPVPPENPGPGMAGQSGKNEDGSAPLQTDFQGKAAFTPAGGNLPARCEGALHLTSLDLDGLLKQTAPPPSPADSGSVRGAPNLTRPTVGKGKQGVPPSSPSSDSASPSSGPFAAKGPGGGGVPGAKSGPRGDDPAAGGAKQSVPAPALPAPDMALDFTLDADAVSLRSLPLRRVHITLQYKEKQALIPFEAEVFGGKIGGAAKLDLRKAEPRASLQGTVKNLNMEEATRALSAAYSVTGTLGATLDLAGHGRSGTEFAHSLGGKAAVLINRGEVRGFSLIPSDLPHIKPLPANFPFERMGASAKISQGVATSKDISLQAPLLTARGGGAVHLAYGQMDLGVDFLAAGLPPAIPVSISGPYNSLSYSVDMRTFLRNVAESALQAPDKAGNLLRDVGGKLFQ